MGSRPDRSGLQTVIAVAREELADREPDDVPNRLRKVAASSARRLPPPLERSLIDVLTEDAAFRGAVIERWERGGVDDELGRAFLDDPRSGLAAAERESSAARTAEAERRVEALEQRVDELEASLAESKRRIADVRATAADELASARAADRNSRQGLERAALEARSEAEEARIGRDAAVSRVAALEAELEDLRGRFERSAERERRRDEPQERTSVVGPASAGARDLAVWLDAAERAIRPYRAAASTPETGSTRDPLRLAPGVAPDRPEAIDAVLHAGPDRFIIDGYNLSGALDRTDFTSRRGRDRVVTLANALARASDADVVVVFDASGRSGRIGYTADLGVSIRFATEGTADDLIVGLVADGSHDAVVSNDRELRERCEALGAVAVWSDALIAWAV